MSRILLSAAVIVVAAVAVPSVAHGATLYQDGRASHRILLQDASGETNLVSVEGSAASHRRIELDLGDGPDNARIATPRPVAIEGGNGPDRYVAHAEDWPSRVDFDGGIGLDVANYFFATAGVEVSLDLEAGDGRPGDDDQIRRDVETVLGSQFDDALTGSPYTTRLAGNDGDDQIAGGSGEELLSGGEGQDRIDARDGTPDTVDCGGQLLDWAAVDLTGEASITGCAQVTS
jgi:Ca2+-binding RTX toxin-like protein